ncbi:MAG: PorT family protein [Pedobacter sp.]|nr:PorT family protein [Pedobacter sp.]
MKHLIFKTLLASGLLMGLGQIAKAQTDTVKTDSVKRENTMHHKNMNVSLSFGGDKKDEKDSSADYKPHFLGGLTFNRIDLGFSRLVDNGSSNLSSANDFLAYRGGKTSTFSFDVAQFGYRFTPSFKIYVAGGFDWTLIRLRKNITIQKAMPTLAYENQPVEFSKNRFSSSYVHIPLNFEFRTKENHNGNRFFIVVGPEIGFLLNGKVKQISKERGKEKSYDDYHFQGFRYGGTLRLGYAGIGIFTKYYFSDMFNTSAQAGLKNFSFGVTLGIN